MFYGTVEIAAKDQFFNWQQWQKSNRIFLTRVEEALCLYFLRCGRVLLGALGSSCGAVQIGTAGHLYSRLSRKAAFRDRQITRSREVSRVSGAPAEEG